MLYTFFWCGVFSDDYFNVFMLEQVHSLCRVIHSHDVYLYEYFIHFFKLISMYHEIFMEKQ